MEGFELDCGCTVVRSSSGMAFYLICCGEHNGFSTDSGGGLIWLVPCKAVHLSVAELLAEDEPLDNELED